MISFEISSPLEDCQKWKELLHDLADSTSDDDFFYEFDLPLTKMKHVWPHNYSCDIRNAYILYKRRGNKKKLKGIVCQIVRMVGFYIKLKPLSFLDGFNRVWVNIWSKSLRSIENNSIPRSFLKNLPSRTLVQGFIEYPEDLGSQTSRIQVGTIVELLHNYQTHCVRPARVLHCIGSRLCLSVEDSFVASKISKGDKNSSAESDSNEGNYNEQIQIWLHESSPLILHTGWAILNGYDLIASKAYIRHARKIATSISENDYVEYGIYDFPKDIHDEIRREFAWEGAPLGDEHVFSVKDKLEYLDPMDGSFTGLQIGTISQLLKYGFIEVKNDDDGTTCAFHQSSSYLFPAGYAKENDVQLHGLVRVRFGRNKESYISNKDKKLAKKGKVLPFDWDHYLQHSSAKVAPKHFFKPNTGCEHFKVSTRLEAFDQIMANTISSALIAARRGRLLEIFFDGWGSRHSQLYEMNSPDLMPIGWSEIFGKYTVMENEKADKSEFRTVCHYRRTVS